MPWANKPDADIHAEVVTDPALFDALHQFCVDNPLPRWLWHTNEPPYPSRNQFDFYFERGNHILQAIDQDGEIWGMRINSRKDEAGIWLNLRREEDHLHEPMQGEPMGGATANSRTSIAHMQALSWALAGGIQPMFIPGDGVNKNVARLNHNEFRARAIAVYHQEYAPQHGLA